MGLSSRFVRRHSLGATAVIVWTCRRRFRAEPCILWCRILSRLVRIAPVRAKDVRTRYVRRDPPVRSLAWDAISRLEPRPLSDPV
jgi:hypothetical protein